MTLQGRRSSRVIRFSGCLIGCARRVVLTAAIRRCGMMCMRCQRLKDAFVPLAHPAGHAQADFVEAWSVIDGVTRKVHVLVVARPHSDAVFVKAYPAETAEAFCEGHVAALAFFGGVSQPILYDNTRLAVAKIFGDGARKRSTLFVALQSYQVLEDR